MTRLRTGPTPCVLAPDTLRFASDMPVTQTSTAPHSSSLSGPASSFSASPDTTIAEQILRRSPERHDRGAQVQVQAQVERG
eukprot:1030158-Rhodomonas_salina.2